MEILESLPRRGPNTRITGIKSPKRLWDTIRTSANCPDLRLHDLRHSFASVAIFQGYIIPQIGELIGHRSEGTTERYAHLMDEAASAAAEIVAGSINERQKPKCRPPLVCNRINLAALYPNEYNQTIKPIRFLGDSLKCLREFPEDARHDAGYQLDKVQRG